MSTTENVLKKIKESSFYQKIEQEEDKKLLDQREKAAMALDQLAADTKPGKKIQELRKAAQEAVNEAQNLLEEKKKRRTDLQAQSFALSNRTHSIFNKNVSFLENTADTEIDEGIYFFRKCLRFLRSRDVTVSFMKKEFNFTFFKKQSLFKSNIKLVEMTLNYCMDAIEELRQMKLLPECNFARINELKNDIPERRKLINRMQRQ